MARFTIPPTGPIGTTDIDQVEAVDAVIKDRSFEQASKGARDIATLNELLSNDRTPLIDAIQVSTANANGDFNKVMTEADQAFEQVKQNNLQNISDPELAREYGSQLDALKQNELLKAKGLVQDQQLGRMRESFGAEHRSLLGAIEKDPFSPAIETISEFTGKVEAARAAGLFEDEEAAALVNSFREDAGRAQANGMIQVNPSLAKEMIQESPEAFGLTEEEAQEMMGMADKRMKDQLAAQSRADAEMAAQREAENSVLKADLTARIKSGEAGEAEIEASRSQLSAQDITSMKQELTKTRKERKKSDAVYNRVMDKVRGGGDLNEFNSGQINSAYNKTVDKVRDIAGIPEGEPVPLGLRANVARLFNGPVTQLSKEISFQLENATEDNAVEALNAYRVLSLDNPRAIERMSKQDHAMASFALDLIDKTGAPDVQAIRRARAAMNVDDSIRRDRASEFGRINDFRTKNIEDTARDALGGDPFFGFNRDLAPGVAEDFRDLAREAYTLTGNEDAAMKSAAQQMKRFYGETSFNGGRHIMFAPPEKIFPSIPVENIKRKFAEDVATVFPNLDPEKIRITGDDLTRARRGTISWALTATDSNGFEFQLQDPRTGELLRWEVNVNDFRRSMHKEQIQKLREEAKVTQQIKESSILTDETQSLL